MTSIKKLVFAAFVAMVGLCGTAWAEEVREGDFLIDPATGTLTQYAGTGGDVEIPAQISGVEVKAISSYAFHNSYEDTLITSVTIPAGVTNIEENAFATCGNLANVAFEEGCKTISASAFRDSGLTSVTIPASVTNIGKTGITSGGTTPRTRRSTFSTTSVTRNFTAACGARARLTDPARSWRPRPGSFVT